MADMQPIGPQKPLEPYESLLGAALSQPAPLTPAASANPAGSQNANPLANFAGSLVGTVFKLSGMGTLPGASAAMEKTKEALLSNPALSQKLTAFGEKVHKYQGILGQKFEDVMGAMGGTVSSAGAAISQHAGPALGQLFGIWQGSLAPPAPSTA